jgi:4-hydroxy-3-methylbut-2-en-1-yl diphosphate reductase
MMKVEIDPRAGFCFGVRKAVQAAEEILGTEGQLYCLGDLVHNEEELQRLTALGLKTVDHDEFRKLANCKVLIRAHGEPPETYSTALKNNIELIDATCPVVLRLQDKIERSFNEMQGDEGQLVIYGKKSHAEVRGLDGQTGYRAIVIEKPDDLDKLDYRKPIHLYAQTTMNREDYKAVTGEIEKRILKAGGETRTFHCTQSICQQVSGRVSLLRDFCRRFDIILFVSSPKSSNGRVLFEECRRLNVNSHFISGPEDLQAGWFTPVSAVGITGATSTPVWLMEKVAQRVKQLPV